MQESSAWYGKDLIWDVKEKEDAQTGKLWPAPESVNGKGKLMSS